jgi:hypothetical protein
MQTRTSRRASSRSSTTGKAKSSAARAARTASSRSASKRSSPKRSAPSLATLRKRWETPLRRSFFSDAGRFAASMGVSVEACVAHVRALQPDCGFSPFEADTIRSSVLDLVLVVGCAHDAPQAWSELRLQHTWRLREALNTWAPSRDAGLQIERFWIDLRAATTGGNGLAGFDPRRPLSRWLADRLFGQVQHSRDLASARPCAPALALDKAGEGRTLRFPLIAAVQ